MNRGESKILVGQLFNIIRDFSTISSYSTFTIGDLAISIKKKWMNQDSFYRLLSTYVYHSAHVPLNLYIHLSKATYAQPQLCLLLEQNAMQISSSTCSIPIHWVFINMETLLPPSKPLFSWLHPLSYVSFLCPFKSASIKSFLCCLKILFPYSLWDSFQSSV